MKKFLVRLTLALTLTFAASLGHASSVSFAALSDGNGPYRYGLDSWVVQFVGNYGFQGNGALVGGSESFAIYDITNYVTTPTAAISTYDWGTLSLNVKGNSFSGTLSNVTFDRTNTGLNILTAYFTGTDNGKPYLGTLNQNMNFVDGGPYWSGGALGNGTMTEKTLATPEPGTLSLLGTGLFGLAGVARRRLAQQKLKRERIPA